MPRKPKSPSRYPDRYQVGYKSWYCFNEDCPDSKWHNGYYRFVPAEHFDENGMCRNRTKTAAKEG